MGVSHSVELFADQDSPTDVGQKSVMTASLDDLDPPVTAEQFLAEFIDHFKWPIDPAAEAVLKSCTVTEASADDFTVKVILDGAKLDSYGYGKGDGTDRMRSWKRVVVDRVSKRITTHDYVPEPTLGAWVDEASDKEAVAVFHMQLLSGPTRAEFWVVDKEGTRLSDAGLAQGVYHLTDRVVGALQAAAKAKVKVAPGKSIRNQGEDSVLTQPMEEHVDYDSFFDKMTTVMKEKMEKLPNAEVEVAATEVVVRVKEQDADGKERVHTHTIKHSAESGEMVITHTDQDGKIVNTSFRQVHKSPLVVEAWNITRNGDRTAGAAFAKMVQKEVNEIIERANSWFG
eukprot:CAMPEP_0176049428 /NCGR_PEP_ID=MMETSP0120_2-20121206/24561_1 /TAXON_ID=160619 /ORGANISM="Kryptoperidinium foliaceum, Strain CCMP 1326" /LENGTH=341 /DNA_ID=CAMNT_0017382855 /DNA_START=44 /DNA_END=1069 /DNA_ORIENTATION=-